MNKLELNTRQMMVLAALIADEKKANDVVVINFDGQSVLYDYVIIASALSTRETRAIAKAIDETVKLCNPHRRILQGLDSGYWILLDYGSIVVHIFAEQDRENPGRGLRPRQTDGANTSFGNYRLFYDLESLWSDVPRYDYQSDCDYERLRSEYLGTLPEDEKN